MNEEGRFWPKVDRNGPYCWPWLGAVTGSGYGYFRFEGKSTRAHRVSYIFANGSIPHGMHIDHLCGNRLCVRPSHLEAVTQKTNNQRAMGSSDSHCSKGHEYARHGYVKSDGRRRCRTCRDETARAYYQRKKAA